MNLQTVIRPNGEESFDSIYDSLSLNLPEAERITLYVHRPHFISCSIDPREYKVNVEVYGGRYLSLPVHSSDLGGMPKIVGTVARQLAKGELSLEEKFIGEVKTVISFNLGIKDYFSRGFEATSVTPGTVQIIKPYLLATSSVDMKRMYSMGVPKLFAFNFLSDYARDRYSSRNKKEKLNELPDGVRLVAEELLEAAKRNRSE